MKTTTAVFPREKMRIGNRVGDFLELTKPRIAALVLLTVTTGAVLARGDGLKAALLCHALVGTALVAGGASALNHWFERDQDALMHRTRRRPLPDGRIQAWEAVSFGMACGLAGVVYLAVTVNLWVAVLGTLSFVLYAGVYTPLKQHTPWNTLIGALPGALPALIGWFAMAEQLRGPAISLFLIVLLWQFPHFFAIAWLYRDDYRRGGMQMLSTVPHGARWIGLQSTFCALLLAGVSIDLGWSSLGIGSMAWWIIVVASLQFFLFAADFWRVRGEGAARRLLWSSLLHLPVVCAALMAQVLWNF